MLVQRQPISVVAVVAAAAVAVAADAAFGGSSVGCLGHVFAFVQVVEPELIVADVAAVVAAVAVAVAAAAVAAADWPQRWCQQLLSNDQPIIAIAHL